MEKNLINEKKFRIISYIVLGFAAACLIAAIILFIAFPRIKEIPVTVEKIVEKEVDKIVEVEREKTPAEFLKEALYNLTVANNVKTTVGKNIYDNSGSTKGTLIFEHYEDSGYTLGYNASSRSSYVSATGVLYDDIGSIERDINNSYWYEFDGTSGALYGNNKKYEFIGNDYKAAEFYEKFMIEAGIFFDYNINGGMPAYYFALFSYMIDSDSSFTMTEEDNILTISLRYFENESIIFSAEFSINKSNVAITEAGYKKYTNGSLREAAQVAFSFDQTAPERAGDFITVSTPDEID